MVVNVTWRVPHFCTQIICDGDCVWDIRVFCCLSSSVLLFVILS